MNSPVDIAREAWGADLPDWLEALAHECRKTSQNKVAARLGRSSAMISQVLRRKYPGDLVSLEERFRGVFQNMLVECPALGEVQAQICQDWRAKGRTFVLGNPQRVRMYRACFHCPRNKKEVADDAAD